MSSQNLKPNINQNNEFQLQSTANLVLFICYNCTSITSDNQNHIGLQEIINYWLSY